MKEYAERFLDILIILLICVVFPLAIGRTVDLLLPR